MELLRTLLDIALRVIGYASIPLAIAGVVAQIRATGRQRSLAPPALLGEALISVAFLLVYVLILRVTPAHALSWPLLIAGGAVGTLLGKKAAVYRQGSSVTTVSGWWHLAVWAAAFALTQLLALLADSEMVAIGLSTVFLSTGLVLGQNGALLVRAMGLAPQPAPSCAGCGTALRPDQRFCPRCGRRAV